MDKIQWHPAFVSATEWELKDNRKDLEFDKEYSLGKAPLRIDMLIIKKQPKVKIKNEIGHIFREHNLIEYKCDGDALDIDVFYKGLAYACLYKANGDGVNQIKDDQITLTFMRDAYPKNLIRALKERGCKVTEKYKGIYYVTGALFPIQIIVTKDVEEAKHAALRIVKRKAKEEDIRRFLTEAKDVREQVDRVNADSILQVSMSANEDIFSEVREDTEMNEAVRRVMKDVIEEENKNTKLEAIRSIMRKLKLSSEQAMDALEIPKSERATYLSML